MSMRALPQAILTGIALTSFAAVSGQHMPMDQGAPKSDYPAAPQYQQPRYLQQPQYQQPQYQQPRYPRPGQYYPSARPYAPAPQMQMAPYGRQYAPAMPQRPGYAPGYSQNPAQAQSAEAASAATPETAAGDVQVTIQQMRFNPPRVVVKKGSTVSWQQADRMPHDVVADDGGFASPRMRQGDTFSHTFEKAGTYNYYCSLHRQMRGQVVVVD